MRLNDYVALKLAGPNCGMFKAWRTMVWAIWALLVKPETFTVRDLGEPIELGMGGGQVWRLLRGVLEVVMGLLKILTSALSIALLLGYMALTPLGVIAMRLTAKVLAKRNMRRRAKLLAEARAAMESHQS
ncbi:hypothetical protein D3C84_313280 [compost metagenome]